MDGSSGGLTQRPTDTFLLMPVPNIKHHFGHSRWNGVGDRVASARRPFAEPHRLEKGHGRESERQMTARTRSGRRGAQRAPARIDWQAGIGRRLPSAASSRLRSAERRSSFETRPQIASRILSASRYRATNSATPTRRNTRLSQSRAKSLPKTPRCGDTRVC